MLCYGKINSLSHCFHLLPVRYCNRSCTSVRPFRLFVSIIHVSFEPTDRWLNFYFAPGRGAKYCDEYVCLSARINVTASLPFRSLIVRFPISVLRFELASDSSLCTTLRALQITLIVTTAIKCTVVELEAWDRQTDGRIAALLNMCPTVGAGGWVHGLDAITECHNTERHARTSRDISYTVRWNVDGRKFAKISWNFWNFQGPVFEISLKFSAAA